MIGNSPRKLNDSNVNNEAKPGPKHIEAAVVPTRIAEYFVSAHGSTLTATNFLVRSLAPPKPKRNLPKIRQLIARKLLLFNDSAATYKKFAAIMINKE